MSRALGFAKGDLNPHNFLYPTLYFYVLFACDGAVFPRRSPARRDSLRAPHFSSLLRRSHRHLPRGPRARRRLRPADRLGDVAVRPTARRPGCRRGCARLFLAVAPTAVRDAHYVKHDVPATLLITIAVMAASGLAESAASRARPATLSRSRDGGACDVCCTTTRCSGPAAHGGRLARVGRFVGARADRRDGSRRRPLAAIVFFLCRRSCWSSRGPPGRTSSPTARSSSIAPRTSAGMPSRAHPRTPACCGRTLGLARHPAGAGRPRRAGPSQAVRLPADAPVPDRVPGLHQPHRRRQALSQPGAALRRTAGGRRGRRARSCSRRVRMGRRRDPGGGGRRPRLCGELASGTFFRQADTRTLALDYFRAPCRREPRPGAAVLGAAAAVATALVEALTEHLGDPRKASTKFAAPAAAADLARAGLPRHLPRARRPRRGQDLRRLPAAGRLGRDCRPSSAATCSTSC